MSIFLLALLLFSFEAISQKKLQDSVTVAASELYHPPSFFSKLFLGSNYREVWATPVNVPVFRLSEGFEITGTGGGHQTKSLELKDRDGNKWVLRSVDK